MPLPTGQTTTPDVDALCGFCMHPRHQHSYGMHPYGCTFQHPYGIGTCDCTGFVERVTFPGLSAWLPDKGP